MESADGAGGCRAPLGSQPPSSRRRPPSALTERSSSTRPPTPRTYVRISSFSSSLPCSCCRRAVIDSGPSPPGHVGIRGLRPSLPLCVASSGPGSAVAWRRPCSPGPRHPAHPLASPRERRGSMHTICMPSHLPRADWSAPAADCGTLTHLFQPPKRALYLNMFFKGYHRMKSANMVVFSFLGPEGGS